MNTIRGNWQNLSGAEGFAFTCGQCELDVAPSAGYHCYTRNSYGGPGDPVAIIAICPRCNFPTLIFDNEQYPKPKTGKSVTGVTDALVESIYDKARSAHSASAYAASVLCCRKLLMTLAVSKGAAEGLNFVEYIDYLKANNKGCIAAERSEASNYAVG